MLCIGSVSGGGGGGSGIAGPVSSTDNAVVRWDGVDGSTVQDSPVIISDTGEVTGVLSLTASGAGLPISGTNTTDSASVQGLLIQGDRATPASNDSIYATFQLSNAAGTQKEVSRITTLMSDATASSEDAVITFSAIKAGTLTDHISISSVALYPTTDAALALGGTGKAFASLDLKSAGQIIFNGGAVTLTHSTNLLTLAGGNLALGTNSLTMTGSIASTGSRVTKGWFTNLESTNAPTVGGAAVYYTGGTDVAVADGGSGRSSATAYAVICGGTTSTGAHQSIASVGTSGQVLTSNGAGALPTFQDAAGGSSLASAMEADFATGLIGGITDFSPDDNTDVTHHTNGSASNSTGLSDITLGVGSGNGDGSVLTTTQPNTDYFSSLWDLNFTMVINVRCGTNTDQDIFIGNGDGVATSSGTVAADATSTTRHVGLYIQDGTAYFSMADGTTQEKSSALGLTLTNANTAKIVFTAGSGASIYLNGSGTAASTLSTRVPSGADTNFAFVAGIQSRNAAGRQMTLSRYNYCAVENA